MLEDKVKYPAVVGFVGATLTLLVAFGVDLSQEQQDAVLGFATAGLPVLMFVTGYLSKHTSRPDLAAKSAAQAGGNHRK